MSKKISCHGLRHTCATNRAALGMHAFCLKTLLGHERITTSLEYVHIGTEELRKPMEVTSLSWNSTRKQKIAENYCNTYLFSEPLSRFRRIRDHIDRVSHHSHCLSSLNGKISSVDISSRESTFLILDASRVRRSQFDQWSIENEVASLLPLTIFRLAASFGLLSVKLHRWAKRLTPCPDKKRLVAVWEGSRAHFNGNDATRVAHTYQICPSIIYYF